jgi:hypothetical protein
MILRRVCTLLVVTLVVLASGCLHDRFCARRPFFPGCGHRWGAGSDCSTPCFDACSCGYLPAAPVVPLPQTAPPILH